MNVSFPKVFLVATLGIIFSLSLAIQVEARERGDRVYPDNRQQVETTTPDEQSETTTPTGPIVVPKELLEEWEEDILNGNIEDVVDELNDFIENGGQTEEEAPADEEPVCEEVEVPVEQNDRIRNRSISRTRGEAVQTTTVTVCEDAVEDEQEQEEEQEDVVEEEEQEEESGEAESFEQQVASEILRLMNIEREAEGLPALIVDGMLEYLGGQHSAWMADTHIFSHDRFDEVTPDGCDLGCRLEEVEYPVVAWGENIAWRSATTLPEADALAELYMQGWMNSIGHRNNILSDNFVTVGIGIARDGNVVFATQEFAR